MYSRLACIIAAVCVLTGCETFTISLPEVTPEQRARNTQNWQRQNCNYDVGYEQGSHDASNGLQMNGSSVAQWCPTGARENFMKGYRDGYASMNRKSPTVIIVDPNKYY